MWMWPVTSFTMAEILLAVIVRRIAIVPAVPGIVPVVLLPPERIAMPDDAARCAKL